MFENKLRYPETTLEELQALNCNVLLLSSEPFPFKQKHIDELQPLLPGIKIILVDGEMFSWYGSRLLYVSKYFAQLIRSLPRLSQKPQPVAMHNIFYIIF